jgi:4-alpha-glucanotransferase
MSLSIKPPLPEFIRFGRDICGDLEQAERREWWLSNGLGGYAAGTIAGDLTRRYHGLLIAPVNPPLGRHLVFAKADATLHDGDKVWPLHTNRWSGGAISPSGHEHIESFRLEGRMPVWQFACGDIRIEQRIWMAPGAHTTYVAYRMRPTRPDDLRKRQLRVRLLVNARDHHGDARPWQFNPIIEQASNRLRVMHPNWFELSIKAANGSIHSDHSWIENIDLSMERERGLGASDCHLCVGEARFDLVPGEWVGIVASLDPNASPYIEEAMRRYIAHDSGVLRRAKVQHPLLIDAPAWVEQLVLAADSFLFKRNTTTSTQGESVIAGYPWFGDWGRDTMIALPGLTLATGRFESALRILETFAQYVDQGMLPNVFPGAGEHAEYNTVDAALWYIEAWRAYLEATQDVAALTRVFPVLESIIDHHNRGTRFGIGADPADDLLRAGEPGVQLTWMDAKLGEWVVTPRIGKPVEINALWYNALRSMAELSHRINQNGVAYGVQAERVRRSFQRFIKPRGGLFDVIDGPQGEDASVRPNQIFAVSLRFSPLSHAEQLRVVQECSEQLLGSYGLRSLSPEHTDYREQYIGGVWERDSGYHQGPVWGWLIGHYALALYRVNGDVDAALHVLEPLESHLLDAGLGTISEIFDGNPPHRPRGAPAQAWSVACVLEAWWRLEQARSAMNKQTADRQTQAMT